ncbi:MAG: hypothetical protein R3D02_16360 [Hyphomicrobiales bacterium]
MIAPHSTIAFSNPDIWPRRRDAEFTLSIFYGLIRRAVSADWVPETLSFEHDPNRAEQSYCETARGLPVQPAHQFADISAGLLDRAMPAADLTLHRSCTTSLAERLLLSAACSRSRAG